MKRQFRCGFCFYNIVGKIVGIMVSNNINQNYNLQYKPLNQSSFGAVNPSMQALDAQAVKQTVDNSYLANRVKASEGTNPATTLGLSLGTWYLLSQAMDKYGVKCGGKYEDSVLGRFGNWGDRVQEKFTSTAIGKGTRKVYNSIGNAWRWVTGKNKLAYAIGNTPTQSEWKHAKSIGAGLKGFLAMDTDQLFGYFMKPINSVQKLEQFGYTQAQIDNFANSIKNLKGADRTAALAKEELKALGVKPESIDKIFKKKGFAGLHSYAEHIKARKLGFRNLAEFQDVSKDALKNVDKIYEALLKADDKMSITVYRKHGTLGKVWAHLWGRKVSIPELRNKLAATLGKGNKTKLGRFLPKALGYFLEGTTNRFAGGKLAVFMQAFIFGDMLANTLIAPKGEKFKTLSERFVNDFAYFMALPFGYMAMHKVGGMKYAGLDKNGVEAYRTALKAFNEKAAMGGFATKAEYKAAKKALSDMLKANVKNPITRLFKGIGRVINVGNETRAAYKSASKLNLNLLRKIPNALKNLAGIPLRVAIPMALIVPVVAKLCTKAEHKVFGRPTKSVLDEEKEPEVNEAQINELQNQLQNAQNNPFAQNPSVVPNSQSNLINMYQNGQKYQSPTSTVTNNINNTTIVNGDKNDEDKVQEPLRTYIPSPVGVQIKGEDQSAGLAALSRADLSEKKAMETLAMRW